MQSKNNTILVVLLTIFVMLTLGLGGYIVYDKVLSEDEILVDKIEDEKKGITADEIYKNYLDNLKENIQENYGIKDDTYLYNNINEISDYFNNNYEIELNENLELILNYGDKFRDYKISNDVVDFFNIYVGNGGFKQLYFITSNGELYSADIEISISDNKKIEINKVNKKNIISVIEGLQGDIEGGGASVPIFIDIEGNMYFQ